MSACWIGPYKGLYTACEKLGSLGGKEEIDAEHRKLEHCVPDGWRYTASRLPAPRGSCEFEKYQAKLKSAGPESAKGTVSVLQAAACVKARKKTLSKKNLNKRKNTRAFTVIHSQTDW